jgi:SAM-dependent methyltransferase
MQGLESSDFDLLICRKCGTGRVHPLPDHAQLERLYSSEYYGGAKDGKFRPLVEALVKRAGAAKARQLASGLRPGSRILDVGCGRGTMLGALADLGMTVHGVEVNERAARGVDPRAEIHIEERLSDVGFPGQHFDRVVIWHVLEHLANPRETLIEVRRILKPGGRVAIAVPNFSSVQARWAGAGWFHLDLPRHLYHFPLEGLQSLLESCGFRSLKVNHFSIRQNPFGWVQSALNLSRLFPRDSLYRLLQGSSDVEGVTRFRQTLQMTFFCVGMPISLGLSVVTALLRRGATVSVLAEKSPMAE